MRLRCLLSVLPLAAMMMAAAPVRQKSGQAPAPTVASSMEDSNAPAPVAVALRSLPGKEAALKIFVKPYADATGTIPVLPGWDGSAEALKQLIGGKQVDLALVDGPTLADLCRSQGVARLDWGNLGRDKFVPLAAGDCGAGAAIAATVLAWDSDKLPQTPGWGDFWDVAKYPGRRGLQKTARKNLEIALLADGVSPGDVYRTLRSADGVDRAFRKLDQLKPYVEWWDQPGQPAQFLASGKVLLTSAPAAYLGLGPKAHVRVQWAGCLDEVASWAVPQGAPHGNAALAVIAIASDAARQAEYAKATGFGPATTAGFALLPAEAKRASPSSPEHLKGGLAVDEGFWLENGAKLEARFTAWLAK